MEHVRVIEAKLKLWSLCMDKVITYIAGIEPTAAELLETVQ